MRNIRSRRAISPVIATVILVAVAITVAVAVAYWMGGIAGQYTKFEKVEIQTAVCTITGSDWTIRMKMRNTGTATATLIAAFLNNIEMDQYNTTLQTDMWSTNMTVQETITSGASKIIEFYIDPDKVGTTLSSGTTVNIKIHSAGGMDYVKLIELV